MVVVLLLLMYSEVMLCLLFFWCRVLIRVRMICELVELIGWFWV